MLYCHQTLAGGVTSTDHETQYIIDKLLEKVLPINLIWFSKAKHYTLPTLNATPLRHNDTASISRNILNRHFAALWVPVWLLPYLQWKGQPVLYHCHWSAFCEEFQASQSPLESHFITRNRQQQNYTHFRSHYRTLTWTLEPEGHLLVPVLSHNGIFGLPFTSWCTRPCFKNANCIHTRIVN